MKKAIWILSILLFISISIIVLMLLISKKNNTKLTKENDTTLKDKPIVMDSRDNQIKDITPITNETIKYVTVKENEEKYKKIIDADTIIINDLYDRLYKTNKALKSIFSFQHSLSIFALGGFDTTLKPDIYIGIMYRRYFTNLRFIEPFIGGGVAVKIYEDRGGAALFEVGFKFGKNIK
jgi:hypothetical protein